MEKQPCNGVNMLLLKNDPLWSDLKSDVLKIDGLLEEANQKALTGFIEFEFPDFCTAILLDSGKILHCIEIKNETASLISKSEILQYLKEMKADVGLYRLKREILLLTSRIITSDPVYENMSTQYVDARKLLLTLETEKFSGIVDIQAEHGECYVVLEIGFPAYCVCRRENTVVDHAKCLEEFLTLPEKTMVVNVYRTSEKAGVITMLKEAAREILGEHVTRVEEMLDASGKSKEELLKTVEEVERFTYLFLDKKKAKTLSQRLEEIVEEVI